MLLDQPTLNIDLETKSRIDLRNIGLDVYSRDPSTKVLMAAYRTRCRKRGMGDMKQWFPHLGPMPNELEDNLLDERVRKIAFNAAFEIGMFNNCLGMNIDHRQWYCTMIMGLACSLPGKLEHLMKVLLPHRPEFHKDPEGERLIRLFSYPNSKATHESHPADWVSYARYNRQDVVAETKAFDILLPYLRDYMEELFDDWHMDYEINQRGMPVDYALVDAANKMYKEVKHEYTERLRELTGLENPNSTAQIQPWLEHRGYPFASIKKDRVKIAMRDFELDMEDIAHKALTLRLESTKTSIKKFDKIKQSSVGGRIRNLYQFLGASRTGRWGGRIVQWQNVPRIIKEVAKMLDAARDFLLEGDRVNIELFFGKALNVISSLIRTVVKAPEGRKLVVADLSAIELCVIAWLTDCKYWLKVLAEGKDPYKSFGVHLFNKAYEELTKQERDDSKPAVLGAGYRMGGGTLKGTYPDQYKTGLWGYAENMGIRLSRDLSKRAVKIFRDLSPEIKQSWYDYENAAMHCIRTHESVTVGPITFDIMKPFLRVRLPSGRCLFYCRPRIEMVTIMVGDDETGEEVPWTKETITFEQTDQKTKQWVRRSTHGGVLIENFVQAIARDILMFGMQNAERAGFETIGSVHDELITEVDENDPFLNLDYLIECMTSKKMRPVWAKDIPIKAAGYESKFYKKD